MSSDDAGRNRYTATIDLTSRATKAASHEQAMAAFTEPDPPLPDATPETLPPPLQAALKATGWPSLMPVQQKAIPYMLEGRDLIVQSRTGSGKTGAFLLPLFNLLDPAERTSQVLILTPTRELARQIHEEFERMKAGPDEAEKLESVLVYGGVKYGPQVRALKGGTQVVVGTPGRILDHLERGTFTLGALRLLVLDEADEMLSMGFYPAMRQLKRYLPERRRSYMFSATMPPKVRSLSKQFLDDPGFLSLSVGQVSVDEIEHRYYPVEAMEKDRALVRLIELENPDSAIIFSNTKRDVEYLTQFLKNYGHHADEISGDLTQKAREAVMDRIRRGELRFLVATDVAARGIDISDLSHVFMYDVPQDPEYYVHRSGRTARAGKTGKALALTTSEDKHKLLSIARRYDIDLEEHPVPSDADVQARLGERMTVLLENELREKSNLERERLRRFIPTIEELASEEPELLAMLVDDLYHRHLHAPPEGVDEADDADAEPKRLPKRSGRSDERGRGRSRRR